MFLLIKALKNSCCFTKKIGNCTLFEYRSAILIAVQ